MLEHRAMALLSAFTLMAALAGCGAGSSAPAAPVATAPTPAPVQQAGPLQSVHIAGGRNEVTGASSVTHFAPGLLDYSATSLVSPDIKFTAALSDEDFQRLAALVDAYNLTRTLDELPPGDAPCRAGAVEIEIKRGGVAYPFTIPGSKLCGGLMPPGLEALFKLQNELLLKYTPKTAG